MFKKIFAALLLSWVSATWADFKMIIPQEPGAGTSVWASIIAKHLEKHLGEKIVLVHIPGARDIPGFNKFHNDLRHDPKVIMVSHGGNAESFLGEKVDYNYREYEPIGGMNLSIITAYRNDSYPYNANQKIKFAAGSGNNPDIMAFTLLVCGSLPTLETYKKCYDDKMIFVKGMKSGERRLSFMRGELTASRETTAAFIKHVQPMIEKNQASLWFSHGVLDLRTGKIVGDRNFPQAPSFEAVYRQRWNHAPSGPLYDAYVLVKQYRDVLQKAMWVNKGNPNAERLRTALTAMIADKDARAEIIKDSGDYDWMIGQDLLKAVDILQKLTQEKALRDFIWWQKNALGVEAVFKPELVQR